jgi:ATPase family AAA domain-containing protein 3A/B
MHAVLFAVQTLDAQTEHERAKAQYADQLERKRYVDKINAERTMREEELKRQEQLVQRQEMMKRKTLDYEAELRQKTELARVQVR